MREPIEELFAKIKESPHLWVWDFHDDTLSPCNSIVQVLKSGKYYKMPIISCSDIELDDSNLINLLDDEIEEFHNLTSMFITSEKSEYDNLESLSRMKFE